MRLFEVWTTADEGWSSGGVGSRSEGLWKVDSVNRGRSSVVQDGYLELGNIACHSITIFQRVFRANDSKSGVSGLENPILGPYTPEIKVFNDTFEIAC